MDRWKEGYNDCDMEWRKKIKEILYYNKQNDIDGYNWSSHNIELIVKLEGLLGKG